MIMDNTILNHYLSFVNILLSLFNIFPQGIYIALSQNLNRLSAAS